MSSIKPIRNQQEDTLLNPENSALVIIDYQPTQVYSINSMDKSTLVANIVNVVKIANIYKLPIVLSTVNVATGRNKDTIAPIKELMKDVPSYDRTSINAWEDKEFYEAMKATGRKKLIICALWTEACLTFPAIDAIREGFEVYTVVEAVGGTSLHAHETALRRIEQAGASLISIVQLACEMQRDWDRTETVGEFFNQMRDNGGFTKV